MEAPRPRYAVLGWATQFHANSGEASASLRPWWPGMSSYHPEVLELTHRAVTGATVGVDGSLAGAATAATGGMAAAVVTGDGSRAAEDGEGAVVVVAVMGGSATAGGAGVAGRGTGVTDRGTADMGSGTAATGRGTSGAATAIAPLRAGGRRARGGARSRLAAPRPHVVHHLRAAASPRHAAAATRL
jgi:hypothetical protein